MDTCLKALLIDPATGFYKMKRYALGDFFGPVDLGLHLSCLYRSINFGVGLFAGSILPGSNRLVVTGFSPCWRGFYISSLGGGGLAFNNLGINLVSLVGKAPVPSVLYLNRNHGEEIEVEILPIDIKAVWNSGKGGVYSLMDYCYEEYGPRFENDPRILATGPASNSTDFGALASAPVYKGSITNVDTWAGRGGLGSKMLQEHGIAAVIYGGTFLEEDFRDRRVADQWFVDKYNQKLLAKDFESTTKYRFDPKFSTGGTLGVNYATLKGRLLAFNYRSIHFSEEERLAIHKSLVEDHYLYQFNQDTIIPKHQSTCGEPCTAVCKKMREIFKKDYEPYQALGPLCGIFDQFSAEKVVRKADTLGFDAISVGGVVSWLMDLLDSGIFSPAELGVQGMPVFSKKSFDVNKDSETNADLACQLLNALVENQGRLNMLEGPRKWGRRMAREKGREVLDKFIFTSFGRQGWMVPNQYWVPGVLAPMAIMGKYYMYYGNDFHPPRELGRFCAERFNKELIMDNMGICRFHRGWAEEMIPNIIEELYGKREEFLQSVARTASRLNSRNVSIFWESEGNINFVLSYMKRQRDVEGDSRPVLQEWIDRLEKGKGEAARDYWYEVRKGIDESLSEF